MPAKKKQNGDQEEKQFDSPAPIKETEDNTQPPDSKTNNSDNNVQPKFWSKFTISDVIQIFLLLANIGMLIAFIWVSSNQYDATIETLANTEESLEFVKRTTLASDSSTQHSLDIADSSLAIMVENLKMNEHNAKIELRAYLGVTTFRFKQFAVGKEILYEAKLTNTGKTPAYNIKRKGGTKWGGTGIYDSEIKEIGYFGEKAVLGATLSLFYTIPSQITLKLKDSINVINGDKFFGTWGEFIYKDVFGDTHFISYSFEYIAEDKMFSIYNIKGD